MTLLQTLNQVCPHFGVCGGCAHQDQSYEWQLFQKENAVRKTLAEFPLESFLPIQSSPEIYFYRNKMEFSFGDEFDRQALKMEWDPGKVHVGLHPKGRFSLTTPTPQCQLLSEESQSILQIGRASCRERV